MLRRHERAAEWLRIWTDLGRAPRTIDAYARGLAEFLLVCERDGVDPVAATRAQIALFVRELTDPPEPQRRATWSRWTRVRVWPTRRCSSGWCRCGCSTTSWSRRACASPTRSAVAVTPRAGTFGGGQSRPLVAADGQAAVDPGRGEWLRLLEVFRAEPIRNRLMLALAYDSALRREELCSLRTDDLDPAHRTLRVRAETTKTRRGTGGAVLARRPGCCCRATSRTGPRSAGPAARCSCPSPGATTAEPLTLWTWSKVVRRVALAADVPRFSTHTTRHLCLTDLARMGWELHAIATFAGHRSTESTLRYIHLSGRDLAAKLNRVDDRSCTRSASTCSPRPVPRRRRPA